MTAPLSLITQLSPEGEVDAVLPVRWCVPKASVDALKQHGALRAHVLLVARQGRRERRWLTPIENEMTYCQFDRPGAYDLDATIVWNEDGSLRELRRLLIRNGPGSYVTDLYDKWGQSGWYGGGGTQRLGASGTWALDVPCSMEVQVPERFFAREPNALYAWFANLAFTDPPVDQCALRRRFLFSSLVSAVGLGLLAMLGLLVAVLAPGTGTWFGKHWQWVALGVAIPVVITLAVLSLTVLPRSAPAKRLGKWYRARSAAADLRFKARMERQREAERAHWLDELEAMACEGDPSKRASVSDLDPKRRTVRLRFRALKAKVCRPYAAR